MWLIWNMSSPYFDGILNPELESAGSNSVRGLMLDANKIAALLDRISEEILSEFSEGKRIVLVGIRDRGEILAGRLTRLLEAQGMAVDLGTLDITLYRDDLNQKGTSQPMVQATEIEFDIDDRDIILVDDVLWTGRTIRAGLDALMDLGRPRMIRLAVLIDRGGRELPIRADYVGQNIEATRDKRVKVLLSEVDNTDEILVE